MAAAALTTAIFRTGETLHAAKADLPHGEFQAMIERDLTFGPRMARHYMQIAGAPRNTNLRRLAGDGRAGRSAPPPLSYLRVRLAISRNSPKSIFSVLQDRI
jgi:hypothetical protein